MGFLYFSIVLLAIGYAAAVRPDITFDQSDSVLVIEVSCDAEQWRITKAIVMRTLETMCDMANLGNLRSNRVALVFYGCTQQRMVYFNNGRSLHNLDEIRRQLDETEIGVGNPCPDMALMDADFEMQIESPQYKTQLIVWFRTPIQSCPLSPDTVSLIQQSLANPILSMSMLIIVCNVNSGQLAERSANADADADYTFDINGQDHVVSTEFLIDADYDPNDATIFTRLMQRNFRGLITTKACVGISYDDCAGGQCGVGYTQSSTRCDIYIGNTMTKSMEYRVWEICCLTPCQSNNSGNGIRPQWLCRDLPPYN